MNIWTLASFRPQQSPRIGTSASGPIPKNLSIRFGAHRASIYGSTKAAKTMALTPSANDRTRESHYKEIASSMIRPPILDAEFQE